MAADEKHKDPIPTGTAQPGHDPAFYIGWMPHSPVTIAKQVRVTVIVLLIIAVALAIVLAALQKKFSTATFEFGQLTEIKGIYREFPVPSLHVTTGKDLKGRTASITIPLVGYGKHGAEGIMKLLEQEAKVSLQDKMITLKGTLLYSDGKTLLQVDQHDRPLVAMEESRGKDLVRPVIKDLGRVELKGEILDPKCYFGVMKPGHGKPHRDCAIRCMEGGMSPVFYVIDENGATDYYLVAGPHGEKINKQLKSWIADPARLRARAIQYDDWIILYVDPEKDIQRISGLSLIKHDDKTIYCGPVK